MDSVKFIDNSINVKAALGKATETFLHEAAGEIASQAKRSSPVDAGKLKNSWDYHIASSGREAVIGSQLENAVWNELGTGEHALKGNGRKTAWYVPVQGYTGAKKPTYKGKVVIVYGRNGRQFYKTDGKKPNRTLWNAFQKLRNSIIKRAEEIFKEGMK